MANLAFSRAPTADLGGNHPQHHKLVYDSPNQAHSSDQRPSTPDTTTTRSLNHTGGKGRGQSTTDDETNEDDEEDSSANQDEDEEEEEDEEEDPDVLAPFHGLGKGKGKRPAIRFEPAGEDARHEMSRMRMRRHPVRWGRQTARSW